MKDTKPAYEELEKLVEALVAERDFLKSEVAERFRLAADARIKQSEQTFKAQFRGFPLPTILWKYEDDDFVLSDYNDATFIISEGKIRDVVGSKISEFYKDIPEISAIVRECFDKKSTLRKEVSYKLRTTGAEGVFDTHYVYLPPDMVVVHAEDITARKQTEAELIRHREHLSELVKEKTDELRDSEERFRRLTENIPDIVMRWIPDHGLDYVNPSMERILGITAEECIGNWGSFMSRVHPEDVRVIAEAFREMGTVRKEKQTIEYRVVRDDGRTVWLEAIWKPLWDEGGKLTAVEAIARDITDRKAAGEEKEKLQQQLIQSQKMEAIGTMAGGIAHDFNNILATISGTAEMLLRSIPADALHYPKIERILNSSSRAKDLTMKLLTFARKEKLNIVRTGMNGIVRDVIDMLEGTVSRKIKIESSPGEGIGAVTVDANQILQALLNISINACDAMPDGGILRFETEKIAMDSGKGGRREYCVVSISDTGTGLDAELRDKIFEPFFTTKERGKGSGLGLSVSHGIIEAHGGMIKAESGPDGTTFRVYIPVSEDGDAMDKESAEDKKDKRYHGSIFVIDDDPDFVEMTRDALEMQGFDVVVALSGKDAVKVFKDKHSEIDVVMLDMILPGMDGPEIFHELKQIDPGVKTVLCSGYSLEGDATELLNRGVKSYIQKPFSIDELSDVFSGLISGK